MKTSSNLTSGSLSAIANEVIDTMVERPSFAPVVLALDERDWVGTTEIGSPGCYRVELWCTRAWALAAAARMIGDAEASDGTAREVLAELTSMVAGNVKSLIPELEGAPVAIPSVETSGAARPAPLHEVRVVRGFGELVVRIHEVGERGPSCAS